MELDKNKKEEKLAVLESYQAKIVSLQEEILVNTVLTRDERIKLTDKLEMAVRHCYGKISYLNGSYVPPKNDNQGKEENNVS